MSWDIWTRSKRRQFLSNAFDSLGLWRRCALTKARAREERMPLIGLTTKAQADRLLAGSMVGSWLPDSALPSHQQNALLDALVWPEDAGTSLSREERSGE